MDTEVTFELCLRLVYQKNWIEFTGEDFVEKITTAEVGNIIQGCLLVTVGDKLKKLLVDPQGKVKQQARVEAETLDKCEPLNKPVHLEKNEGTLEGCVVEPQFMLKVSSTNKRASSVAYVAEADNHGLFEIRFHRLAHLGDRENSDTFPTKQIEVDRAGSLTEKLRTEAMLLFERFASCSFYYNEVSKMSYNVCPAFYKFKIQPFEALFEEGDGSDSDSSLETDTLFASTVGGLADLEDRASFKRADWGDNLRRETAASALSNQTTAMEDDNPRLQELR